MINDGRITAWATAFQCLSAADDLNRKRAQAPSAEVAWLTEQIEFLQSQADIFTRLASVEHAVGATAAEYLTALQRDDDRDGDDDGDDDGDMSDLLRGRR